MRRSAWLIVLLLVARPAQAAEVVETWDNGTPRRRYSLDEEGKRAGDFTEYFRSGKAAVRGRWKSDRLDGPWVAFYQSGFVRERGEYRAGQREGEWETWAEGGELKLVTGWKAGRKSGRTEARSGDVVRMTQEWVDGRLVGIDGATAFPKPRADIERQLGELLPPPRLPRQPLFDLETDRSRALRRLQAYRYVCDVPFQDLLVSERLASHAQAACRLCAALGYWTHTPTNPGWPAEEFALAAEGCANCNLVQRSSAEASVDAYMEDPGPKNLASLGHRCWCLSPDMARTGFGSVQTGDTGGFTAMWALDDSRRPQVRPDIVAYPTRGWMPLELFDQRYVWSAVLSTSRWPKFVPAAVHAEIQPLDGDLLPRGDPLALDHEHVEEAVTGRAWIVGFRPKAIPLVDGKAFRVRIGPLAPLAEKPDPDAWLSYLVVFMGRTGGPKPGR